MWCKMRGLLWLVLGLGACTDAGLETHTLDLTEVPRTTERDESEPLLEIYFTSPGTESGAEVDVTLDDALISVIDAAAVSVDVCLYEFALPDVVNALVAAHERGVYVRMVGDADEMGDSGYAALSEAGVDIIARPEGDRIMHNKFVVVDEAVLWTGSTNLTHNGLLRNNNNAVLVENADLAAAYTL